jgi:hypothetical protein
MRWIAAPSDPHGLIVVSVFVVEPPNGDLFQHIEPGTQLLDELTWPTRKTCVVYNEVHHVALHEFIEQERERFVQSTDPAVRRAPGCC